MAVVLFDVRHARVERSEHRVARAQMLFGERDRSLELGERVRVTVAALLDLRGPVEHVDEPRRVRAGDALDAREKALRERLGGVARP